MPGLIHNTIAQEMAPPPAMQTLGLIESNMPAPSAWLDKLSAHQSEGWKPTLLTAEEAPQFEQWLYGTKLFNSVKQEIAAENKITPDQLDNARVAQMLMQSGDYDYAGAWKSGIKEEISPHDGLPHWPSKTGDGRWLKSPTHPTSWKETFMEQFGTDPDDMGLHTIEDAIRWSTQKKGD